MIIPVILAGGSGSRLWPLSRAQHPKQFHALVSGEPLLADTARRLPSAPPYAPPYVIANEQNRFSVAAAFKKAGLPLEGIVLEPKAVPPRGRCRCSASRDSEGGSGCDCAARAFGPPYRRSQSLSRCHRGWRQRRQGWHARHLRRQAFRAGNGLRLRQDAGQGGPRRRSQGRALRGEAGQGNGGPALRGGRLFLERWHLPVRREGLPRRTRPLRAGHGPPDSGSRRERHQGPQLHPSRRQFRRMPLRFHRLRCDGEDGEGSTGARQRGLERRWHVGCTFRRSQEGSRRQRHARRYHGEERQRLLRARRGRHGGGGGHRRHHRHQHQGRDAGRQARRKRHGQGGSAGAEPRLAATRRTITSPCTAPGAATKPCI